MIAIQWVRANIALSPTPLTDLRVPASAAIRVTNTSTGAVINAFTLAAGKLRELTVGRNGGFTYAATVTFNRRLHAQRLAGRAGAPNADLPAHHLAGCRPARPGWPAAVNAQNAEKPACAGLFRSLCG